MSTVKFATHIVLFGQDKWIMKNIENSYSHVDRIYIAYSKYPWAYNPHARNNYTNSFDLNKIKESKYIDKITIIEGDWKTEEDQRNACVTQAKKDKIDYLMIHDADEFYFHNDFELIKKQIIENPNFDVYKCAWYNFWKSFDYITVQENNDMVAGYPEIFINLNNDISFQRKRRPTSIKNFIIQNVICYHASYVLTDQELKEKLNTWGHHSDFNVNKWYNNVWLEWNENMKGLHPITPNAWYRAVRFFGKLPEVLR